jgi:predicted lysophospholipase L1 biosynthesis ABC-type transport system permease subunit
MTVVGRSVTPIFFGNANLGEGALASIENTPLLVFDPEDEAASEAVVRWAPDATAADKRRVEAALARVAGRTLVELPPEPPDDIVNFGRVQNMPLVLGAVLALLGAATLAHTLVTAIGRRRRELAVFKTVGFVRRQVTSTVAWQATTMVAIALLVGVPLGVAAGRSIWTLLANQLGVVNEPVTPLPPVLLLVPATVLLANLIAAVPGLLAARIRPALALRAE